MPEPRSWQIGEWRVHPSLNRAMRGAETVSLSTKFMDLLVFLAENQGQVMSKEVISEAVWRREYISDGTLSHAVAQVRQTLGDDTQKPRYIETIPTRGYRLIAAAEPLGDGGDGTAVVHGSPPRTLKRWQLLTLAAAGVAAIAMAAIGLAVRAGHPVAGAVVPERLHGGRLAVLPFDNLGPADRSYLATGVTDDLTSRLAAVPGVAVISRMSAHSVDRAGKSAGKLGAELGVDYLVAGTVRWELDDAGGGVVRVNAQLIRTTDDSHLWVGSYRRPVAQLYEVESEIAASVLAEVGVQIGESERRRLTGRPTQDADAYEAYLSGLRHSRLDTRANLGLAVAMFERAATLDPSFVLAWAELGAAQARLHGLGFAGDHGGLARARAAIGRALEIDPALPEAQRALGAYLLYGERDLGLSLEALRRAAEGLPNDSDLRVLIGDVYRRQGRWDEARAELEALYAAEPRNYTVALALGDTLSSQRRWGAADIAYRRATSVMPDAPQPYLRRVWNLLRWEGPSRRSRAALAELPEPGDPSATFTRFFLDYSSRAYDAALAVLDESGEPVVTTPTMRVPRPLLQCLALTAAARRTEAKLRCAEASAAVAAGGQGLADPWSHVVRAYVHALSERPRAAAEEAERARGLCPLERDAVDGVACLSEVARVYALAGDAKNALAAIGALLERPSLDSAALIAADPRFDRLRNDRRLAELLAAYGDS